MTSDDFRAARAELGLSAAGMATALRLGKESGRTIRRWELGESPITGPAAVAVELMLAAHRRKKPSKKAPD